MKVVIDLRVREEVSHVCRSASRILCRSCVAVEGHVKICGRSSTADLHIGQDESFLILVRTIYSPEAVKLLIHLVMKIFLERVAFFLAW